MNLERYYEVNFFLQKVRVITKEKKHIIRHSFGTHHCKGIRLAPTGFWSYLTFV
jgi:hypothetical protein